MNKTIIFLIFFLFITSCSLNKNSKFWTASQKITEENNSNFKKIFLEDDKLEEELNTNFLIDVGNIFNDNSKTKHFFNNDGRLNYAGILKKSSRFKFSRIENFHQFEPQISFHDRNILFFDNKGSILKFDNNSKLIWKKNYYSKNEKKLKPILQFAKDGKTLVVADNIAKYYALNLNNGEMIWSKSNLAPFNSQIKIYKNKFFIIDFSNTLRCFSLKNGKELWNVKTENSLILSQKKLSMVIVKDVLYFKNSIGDISAVNITEGELLWQLPTQSSSIYKTAFSLETSDLVTDGKTLFFSNNKNQFFSVDLVSGSFNWENKVNSSLRPSLVGNYIFTISLEGYLIVIEKNSGNIIRVTDIFGDYKKKQREKIKPVGFIVGVRNIYLTTDHGRLMIIDIKSGRTKSILKLDNEKISRPFILNENLYVVKEL